MTKKKDPWDLLYRHLAQEENKKQLDWKSTGRVFPSSAGTNCELKLKYDYLGTDKKKDFIWWGCENKIGNAVHDWLQSNFIQKFGESVEVEKWVNYKIGEVKINGKLDILLYKKKVIEIKTVKIEEGKKLKREHVMQLHWYMGVLGLTEGYISYFGRENGIHIKTFKVDFDQKMFDHIVRKFSRIINNAKDLRPDTRECKFCPYSYKCPSAKITPRWS